MFANRFLLFVFCYFVVFLRMQLKAFYVDLIVPLESNIEKDTKVVQVSGLFFSVLSFSFTCFEDCRHFPFRTRVTVRERVNVPV